MEIQPTADYLSIVDVLACALHTAMPGAAGDTPHTTVHARHHAHAHAPRRQSRVSANWVCIDTIVYATRPERTSTKAVWGVYGKGL